MYIVYASKSMTFIAHRLLIQDCVCTEMLVIVWPTNDPTHNLCEIYGEAVNEKYFSAKQSEAELPIFQPRLEPRVISTFSRKKMQDYDLVSAAGD